MIHLRFSRISCSMAVLGWSVLGPATVAVVRGQQLVPNMDNVETPLMPTGISEEKVELFGKLAYVWRDETLEAEVVHYVGDFSLHLGRRRLSAREAVIWMFPGQWEGRKYFRFEVYLWQDATIRETGGTISTGPVFFVTLNSFAQPGNPDVAADLITRESSADTPLYQEALGVRRSILAREHTPGPQGEAMHVLSPDTQAQDRPPPVREAVYIRPGREMISDVIDGERLTSAIGNVYISQGAPNSADFTEIRAQSAVFFSKESELQNLMQQQERKEEQASDQPGKKEEIRLEEANREDDFAEEKKSDMDSIAQAIQAAYLEGDVVLSRGSRIIRASRLYYDFENSRALILDAVMSSDQTDRGVPIYVRAKRVRQLSSREYEISQAKISTSEFHTPHYHIGAEKLYVEDRAVTSTEDRIVGLESGAFRIEHATFNINNVPFLYWPYIQGDFRRSESSLKRVSAGYSGSKGMHYETEWDLFNLMGVETPEGVETTLLQDYFSKRGPAVGINVDYERENYFGLVRSYYVNDHGEDRLGGIRGTVDPDHENRARALVRHRQYLPQNWELTLELSYISDDQFLEEYSESEFDEGKDQETLVYLKKQEDIWAFTTLMNWRILPFVTQTEHLPDFGFHLLGLPLGDVATFYNESRAGIVRFRGDQRRLFDEKRFFDNTQNSASIPRADTRNEVDVPLALGPFKLLPFATQRLSYWSDSPHEGKTGRYLGVYGLRGTMYFSKTDPTIESRLFDLHGIKHIIKPEVVAWLSHNNVDSEDLHPFDPGVEDLDSVDGVTASIRQRWQTKRGRPGNWRKVDWVVADLSLGAFNDERAGFFTNGSGFMSRPENSVSVNFLKGEFEYRISDSTVLLSDADVDLNDGDLGTANISMAVERSPRFSYFYGFRFIDEIDSSLFGFGFNYKMSEKHTLALRNFFDLDRGETAEFDLTYIRKLPRWYVGTTFELDEIENDVSIKLSAWPEGLPEATVGSRRYTGLATSTGIKP